ncbi:ELWxxDGT repeat protein, partial [Estrella lausannensis]|uniref:ELWxxDGT repeat protein n=1 Tax=Estrella lausannensis TaxID=483423 RepID=UPI001179978B
MKDEPKNEPMKQFRIIPLDERILFDAAAMVDFVQQVESSSSTGSNDPASAQHQSSEKSSDAKQTDSNQAAKDSNIGSHKQQAGQDESDHETDGLSLAQTIDPIQNQADGIRVLVVSSEIRDATTLSQAALNGVKIVYYDASTTTTEMLTAKIAQTLDGEQADSIAFAGFGEADGFHLTQGKVVSAETIENDTGLQKFWNEVGNMVKDDGRVDILACNLVSTDKGLQLIAQIDQVVDHDDDGSDIKVAASNNLTGSEAAGGDWVLEKGGVDVAKTYFNTERLSAWNQVLDNTAYQIADINASGASSPANFVDVNGTLYFTATTSTNGLELWKSDGSAAGTVLVKDINPGTLSSSPGNLTNVNGTLFFTADDGSNGVELWKSDGTAAGTTLVKNIYTTNGSSNPTGLTNISGILYFSASDPSNGTEVWRSDGTSSGTYMIADVRNGSPSSNPTQFTEAGGKVFFAATTGASGTELWVTDGTAGGTKLVKEIRNGGVSSDPTNLINLNGTLYFTADDGSSGPELWKSDGTAVGTTLVKDIFSGKDGSSMTKPVVMNGNLYFAATTSTQGSELWKSDGTAAGTVIVKDISSGTGSSSPSGLTVLNNTLYFAAASSTGNVELWKSDGTTAGTEQIAEIETGSSGSSPQQLTAFNGKIYFTATTTDKGTEVWVTDGTSSGTVLVKDIRADTTGSAPTNLTVSGTKLYFSADDGSTGQELWGLDTTASVDAKDQSYSLSEDNSLIVPAQTGLLTNIVDPNGGAKVLSYTSPAHGNLEYVNADGSFKYTPNANFSGQDGFSFTVQNKSGGTDTATVTFTVSAFNDAPVNQVPATASVNEDSLLTFSAANGNQISVGDVDASSSTLQVTLTSANGTMSLSQTNGLTFTAGSGTNSSNMVFTGTAANINAALNGLTFSPSANFSGTA